MPRERSWLSRETIRAAKPIIKSRGVSKVATGPTGFLAAFARAGYDPDQLSEWWRNRRNNFLARHLAQVEANAEALWSGGEPTRRHLALVAWAYSPTRARLERWLARHYE